MPQSAILAEVVDFILSPDKIAKELSKIAKNPHLVRSEIISQEPKITKETGLRKIFTLLKTSFNVDFSHYKDGVINRRVTRRMVINHIDKITDYADYLGTHHTELKALFDDMLIGVTSFFREPKTFETLKEKLLPELLKNRDPKEPLRIWIPGCSTGEEAYSFAIAIQEFLEENRPSDSSICLDLDLPQVFRRFFGRGRAYVKSRTPLEPCLLGKSRDYLDVPVEIVLHRSPVIRFARPRHNVRRGVYHIIIRRIVQAFFKSYHCIL